MPSGGRGNRLQRFLQLLGVLLGQRGPDHGSAVLLERGDRLVRRDLLDDHEQRRGARLQVVAHLLLEGLVDPLLAEVAEQRSHPGPEREPEHGNEKQQPEQEPPEAAPGGASARRCATVGGVNVILTLKVTRDRRRPRRPG